MKDLDLLNLSKQVSAKFEKNETIREDLELVCLEAAYKAKEFYRHDTNPAGFFYRVMSNAVKNHLKQRQIKTISLDTDAHEKSVFGIVDNKIILENFLNQLPPKEQIIMRMLGEGYSLKEIASELETTEAYIAKKICVSRKKWLKIFE